MPTTTLTAKRRRIVVVLALAVLLGVGLAYTGRADATTITNLSRVQYAYVTTYGPTLICAAIAADPTPAGAHTIGLDVMTDGFTEGEAIDILNAAALMFCPDRIALMPKEIPAS